MEIRPSDIRFSQDSINNVFDKRSLHSYKPIGQTLDELCEYRCSVNDIPRITVVKEGGKWITADNRRLWVFRELERLGKCETIPVIVGSYIPLQKRTSYNDGTSILVRGNPGGIWHRKPTVSREFSSIRSPPEDRWMGRTISRNDIRNMQRPQSQLNRPVTDYRQRSIHGDSLLSSLRAIETSLSSMTVRVPRSCVTRHSYGFKVAREFVRGVHPEERRVVSDGEDMCDGYFDKFITKDMYISVGEAFKQRIYTSSGDTVPLEIYRSSRENPTFVDEPGCSFVDDMPVIVNLTMDPDPRNRRILVEVVYDGMNLKVQAKVLATGRVFKKEVEFN